MTQDKKIVFACAVRNCEYYLNKVYSNISKFTTHFNEYKIVFSESDSQDNTTQAINELKQKDHNIDLLSLGNLDYYIPQRTCRIAYARNAYLEHIQKNYSNYDYLCVFDCDDRSSEEITIDAFFSNFKYDGWDMICANQENKYYDLWALRHPYWMPVDLIKTIYVDKPSFISQKDANNMYSHSRRIHIDKNHPPFQVQSAFGGMAIIKIESIKGAKHIGYYENGMETCEWVSFCLSLNKGHNKILINPAFINGKGDN